MNLPQISPNVKKILIAAGLLALLGGIAGVKINQWWNDHFHKTVPTTPVLKPDEKGRLTVEGNKVTITTDKGTKEINGVRHTDVTLKKDGSVVLNVREKGFMFEPGLSASITDNGPRAGVDVGFAYWRRLDLIIGVAFNNKLVDTRGYLAVGYTPSVKWLSNTDFFVGITTSKAPIGGVRLRF
jgi:hypothetical protein